MKIRSKVLNTLQHLIRTPTLDSIQQDKSLEITQPDPTKLINLETTQIDPTNKPDPTIQQIKKTRRGVIVCKVPSSLSFGLCYCYYVH